MRLTGSEQLVDWMRRRGFNKADAARYLEFPAPYVSYLISGDRTPGLANAIKIERLTGIPVEAWTVDESGSERDESESAVPVTSGKGQE
jgi:plasmid maintenance system antidote protein VapI